MATIFKEPLLESGYPDIVIVVWKKHTTLSWGPERESLDVKDLRIMHFLHYIRRASEGKLVEWFGKRVSTSIQRLHDAEMIKLSGSSWIPCGLRRSFAATQIIAIEAKINKLTNALNQALLNTWFASKSYILVPKKPSEKLIAESQRLGIGILALFDEKVFKVSADSKRLPRSYASWLLNEWAWRYYLHNKRGQAACSIIGEI